MSFIKPKFFSRCRGPLRSVRAFFLTLVTASLLALTGCSVPSPGINSATAAALPATISVQGQALAYLQQGNGPAVVIVHGIGGHKEDWRATMAVLAPKYTVFAIDMIGFGGSATTSSDITIRTQVEAVRALLDAKGIAKASIIGNSVGGWVAATFASLYPQRVEKLVLVDPAGFKAMFEGPSPVNFYPTEVAEMQKLLSYVRFAPATQTPEFAQAALAALNASGDRQAAKAVFKGLFASPRLESVLPGITAPTLVLWGAQDKLFPPALLDMITGQIGGAKKQLIPQAGHFPQLDNPGAFHQAVFGFLP